MDERGKVLGSRLPARLTVVGLVMACVALSVAPAHAAETSAGPTGRFLTGAGDYQIVPAVGTNSDIVFFECSAKAGPDARETRIHPPSEGGCVLYKGGVKVAADGATYPGPAAFTYAVATVSRDLPGQFMLCWHVSATYILDGAPSMSNTGCTAVND